MSASPDRKKFEALFEDVWIQVYRLEINWTLHRSLFGERDTVAVLIATAPVAFGAIQLLLTDMLFLATHRLLDAGVSRGRRTASIETLLHHLPPEAAPLRRSLKKTLKGLRVECKDLSQWRHRGIAHRDYAIALEEDPDPPDPVKIRSFQTALAGFAEILTAISEKCGLNLTYQPEREVLDLDVDRLIERLRNGTDALM